MAFLGLLGLSFRIQVFGKVFLNFGFQVSGRGCSYLVGYRVAKLGYGVYAGCCYPDPDDR